MFERQIRTEIVAVLPTNTTTADYGYGPFRQPDRLFPEIPGIVVSSPLWDYNPRKKQFRLCDHPDYGRSVFLANPYTLTINKRAWGTIPCQVCNLQAQYWFEDKRQRFVRPLAERINNLGRRDYEDPLNISNNFYRVTHRNIPRRVRFVDEDGELEPRWTPRELADRVASEQRGVEYVRPYILLRRQRRRAAQMAAMQMAAVEEQTGVTMDTLTNVDAQSSEQPEQRRQRQSDALFEELIRTIDNLDDTNEAHMAQVPLDDDERAEGDLVVVDVDAQRNALDRTLNSVLGTGNLIVLLGLMRSRNASLGLGDIDADVLRDLQLRLGNEIGGSDQPGRQRQIGRIQEVAENSEDGLDDAAGNSEVGPDDAAENINSNVDRSDDAADQEDPA
ncbi:hypothetical protein TWF173_001452 [Orbilia oligospora]|nr:hypothetical protein TWF173_001452 [Orbilia oligospora]